MKIEDAKVLIVGAGGIGCELLKNAVLSGFRHIHLVDLDTIELSNLNRQFLFRRRHIGQSKAQVAREAAIRMKPDVDITAHFANITDTQLFPISFFQQFDVVMNALDNLAARRYVNSMCLMVQVPLIESGTAGYLGQTSIIIGRKTECFDCIGKEAPKTFPVCTIRSTPSTLIHCIIWAKEFLLPNLFGSSSQDSDATDENETLKEAWNSEQEAFSTLEELKNDPEIFYEKLFKKLFIEDIEKIRGIEELWKDRTAPIPLLNQLSSDLDSRSDDYNDHEIWDISSWIKLFKSSIFRLLARSSGEIVFDKDDMDTLDLVASSANIRAGIFGIGLESKFEIKAMAGNIIPAIATTNAIAAGMIIIHAKNILEGPEDSYCNAYIKYGGSGRNAFTIEKSCPPNPDCPVCSCDRGILTIDCETCTIKDLIDLVVPFYSNALAEKFPEIPIEIDEEEITIIEGNRLIYDIFDDNQNNQKFLSSLGISGSKFIKIDFGHEKRPLLLGIAQSQSAVAHSSLELNLIEPKKPKAEAEEEDEEPEDDDELVCIFEKDDSIEIIEKVIKKAKVADIDEE